jgi:hypothetical protein
MAKSVASSTSSLSKEESEQQFVQYTQKLIIIASILVAVIALLLLLGETYNKYYSGSNLPSIYQRGPEEIKKDVESYAAVLAGQGGLNTTSA